MKSARWAIATYLLCRTRSATPTLGGAIIWHSDICTHELVERKQVCQNLKSIGTWSGPDSPRAYESHL